MKHRHTFFIDAENQPTSKTFDIVPAKKGEPSVLRIRHLPAAREWKITIDSQELDPAVYGPTSNELTASKWKNYEKER